jgi:hypothetical protein
MHRLFAPLAFLVCTLTQGLAPVDAQQQSSTCQFTTGPRAGSTIDFTGVRGVQPGQIGGQCQDGLGSTGVFVAPQGSPPTLSLTCRFTIGPRAGLIFDFTGLPGALPGPIGAPCQDGMGSAGDIVDPSTPGVQRPTSVGQPPSLSLTCKFFSGPRAGQVINFQGVLGARPGPVGGPCTDGMGSGGTIIP